MAKPRPLAPPVMKATFPATSFMQLPLWNIGILGREHDTLVREGEIDDYQV
jgi:hypothetical protein